MKYFVQENPQSRSFPGGDPFLAGASARNEADVLVITGDAACPQDTKFSAVLVELDLECLGARTGEGDGEEGSNVVGFARYRNGNEPPSSLIELVRQKNTAAGAIEAAKAVLQAAGFSVSVCTDQPGRIIDRLVRPKYNVALRFLDEGLASRADIDLTCQLGLGYPDGPIERVIRGGLGRHYDIAQALFETYGNPGFAPARRSVVAKQRREN
ncbi:3-hydroxyacyl-CoA dehydrogenase family protein [Nitratireductor luteus]|uniref:3-hydroxyacyl-CoA dehydrogenase family protein n=1 Tax=Nitratireductor luteus TaxID=2976980 RepID=UPI002240E121|nr:3-hydroxyacyl-CoA dehydrogenase family protein [Nitratireductor luteus]